MNTASRQTIGVELPRSGNGVRQRTFSLVPQRKGSLESRATPVPSGPRHAGQFAQADVENNTKATKAFITKLTHGQRLEFRFVRFSLVAYGIRFIPRFCKWLGCGRRVDPH